MSRIGDMADKFALSRINRRMAPGTELSSRKAPKQNDEIGVQSGSMTIIGNLWSDENRADKIKIEDYRRMLSNDGTCQAMYNLLTLPILANNYDFHVPEEYDEDPDAQEITDFVKENFMAPPYRGGMSTPFQLVLSYLLKAVSDGFATFEKVFTINEEGRIIYKKLAPRDAKTMSLDADEHGGFDGAKQRVVVKSTLKDFDYPVEKLFLFTFGKDKDWLYGESAFKSAYYHYIQKHKLYYLANRAVEVGAIPPAALKLPANASEDDKKLAMSQFKKWGVMTQLTLPAGYDLDLKSLTGRIDPMGLIDHHNAEMARSILAQFMMLGTQNNAVGSWALSQDQSDVFIMALKGLMENIEYHINSYLVADLVDYNFDKPIYPEFKFSDMTSATQEVIRNAFTEIIKRPDAPEWLIKEVSEKAAEQLDLEIPEEEEDVLPIDQPVNPNDILPGQLPGDAQIVNPIIGDPNAGGVVGDPSIVNSHMANSKKKDSFWRDLTPAEQSINLVDIEAKMNGFEKQYQDEVKPLFDKIREDAVQRLTDLLEAKKYADLDSFELNFKQDYIGILTRIMTAAYNYAKKNASDDLKLPAPATPKDTRAFIEQDAKNVADKQFSELLFKVKAPVLEELRKNTLAEIKLGITDVIAAASAIFGDFFDNSIPLTGGVIVSQAINRGRNDVFDTNRKDIAVYQFSAILDDQTCPICEDLDGTVTDYSGYRSTAWEPPIHFSCRCIWIAIKADQTEIPDLSEFPATPGGIEEPLL